MHRSVTVGAIALIALASAPAFAKAPNWVRPIDRPIPEAPAGATGMRYLLIDTQIRHAAGSIETYHRHVVSLLDEDSLKYMKRLWFDLSLVSVAHVRIRRGDDELAVSTKATKEFDEEDQMDYFVIDLPELAVGDVVDYAWLERTPSDDDFIAGWLALSPSSADWTHWRLLVPSKADVKTKLLGADEPPKRDLVGEHLEYVWESDAAPPGDFARDAPGWHFQSPVLQYSNVPSWETFGKLLAERYAVARPPDAAITELAESLVSPDKPAMDRARAAAQYVQQTIKPGIGGDDGTPRSPDAVVRAGAGTPLERALLLAALLRALGLDASVGVGYAPYREHLRDMLPGADTLYDAVTGVNIGGELVWLDPIGTGIASEVMLTPAIGTVLLVDPASPGLVDVPTRPPSEPGVDVLEIYALDADGGATMTLTTTLRGDHARHKRQEIAYAAEGEEIVDNVRTYDRSYERVGKPEVDDDPVANRLRIVERFRIADYWADGTRTLAPYELVKQITIPADGRARAPLAIPHPRFVRHAIQVSNLPKPFHISRDTQSFDNDAFGVTFSQEMSGRTLSLKWEYRTRASYVPADRVDAYRRALETLPSMYYLKWTARVPGSPYWHKFLVIVAVFLLAGWGLQTSERRRVRRRATARVMRSESR